MTLVVAQIHDGGITLVSDTKRTLYNNDEAANRQVYQNADLKIVLLRDDLAVGFAGDDIDRAMDRLMLRRGGDVDELIRELRNEPKVHCLLATLSPSPGVWEIQGGVAEDRTPFGGRGWAGEQDAYELFRQRENDGHSNLEVDGRLAWAMRWLVDLNPVDSVGGYLTWATTTVDGFRFVPGFIEAGPDYLEAEVDRTPGGGYRIKFRVPPGADPGVYQVFTAVGLPPTIGATAYYLPQANIASLYCHEKPSKMFPLTPRSMDDLIAIAGKEYGQALYFPRPAAMST